MPARDMGEEKRMSNEGPITGQSPVAPPPAKKVKREVEPPGGAASVDGGTTSAQPNAAAPKKNAGRGAKATAATAAGEKDEEAAKYAKLSHHDHILTRPDTYVGTRQERKDKMFLLTEDRTKFEERPIKYCPALYKIFDEILVNAADHMQRDKTCDELRVEIDAKEERISVENNGSGIPVQMHQTEKMYIPEMVFGNLLAGDNFNDEKQRVTGGRNGYGAKLTNIFSKKFVLETVCVRHGKRYKQEWRDNMKTKGEPEIEAIDPLTARSFTKITFFPDWKYFPQDGFTDDTVALFRKRVYDIAGSTDSRAKVFLDGSEVPIRSFEDFVKMHIPDPVEEGLGAGTVVVQPAGSASAAAVVGASSSSSSSSSSSAAVGNANPSAQANGAVAAAAPPNPAETTEVDGNERVSGIIAREVIRYHQKDPKTGEKLPLQWEVILAYNTFDEFHQVSFANSIRTYKGGSHVQWIKEQVRGIVKNKCVKEAQKKKIKKDLIKDSDIDSEIYVFINALVVNPQFDSQSKETLNTKREQFKSDTALSEQFAAEVEDCAIIDTVLSYADAAGKDDAVKAFAVKGEKEDGAWNVSGKQRRLADVPKLEDANLAGSKRSRECTLILTEGDSAKALAVAGLSIVGRDLYGVFPLRGKPMNVRDAAYKDVTKNNEIKSIMKILGANPFDTKKKPTVEDMRYGSVMIMADQDFDGSHIKGLLLNMFQQYFPHLLQDQNHNFLKEFITPIVKATKKGGNGEVVETKEFYSVIAYEQWREANDGGKGWEMKYYKGLGTSTSKEAKAYFSDLPKHKVEIVYEDKVGREEEIEDPNAAAAASSAAASSAASSSSAAADSGDQAVAEPKKPTRTVFEDDDLIDMVFKNNRADERKAWMNAADDSIPVDTSSGVMTVKHFLNREMVQFSKYDLRRAVPSVIDGLKPSQRKIMFACFKRKLTSDLKVAQLSGYVSEKAAYHHGEVSLQGAIVKLAQNFCGANNVNLLVPSGQFGTRLEGGDDHASSRYIFTRLAKTARAVFPEADDPVLTYNNDEGLSIEPVAYYPVIPLLLANGATGIGTGWSTSVPQFNPRELVENMRRYLAKKPFVEMKPWYRGFTGSIELKGGQESFLGLGENGEAAMLPSSALQYECKGIIRELSRTQLAITELPVGVWTRKYKEKLQEHLQKNDKDTDFLLADMKEHHTDNTVHFILQLTPEKMLQAKQVGLYKQFSLSGQITMTNMHAFAPDHQRIEKYESLADLMTQFAEERERMYAKRKQYLLRKKEQEILEMVAKARFIHLVLEDEIDLDKKTQAELAAELEGRGFPKWREIHPVEFGDFELFTKKKFPGKDSVGRKPYVAGGANASAVPMEVDGEDVANPAAAAATSKIADYGYLLKMKVHQLSEERAALLEQQLAKRELEAEEIRKTSILTLWSADLDTLEKALDDQDRDDGKELAGAQKMNRKVGSADEMTNAPCVLAFSNKSGKIKQVLRQKVVARAHPKNRAGKPFALPQGFVGAENSVDKLLACHNFDTILYVLSDGMVISYPVISIKDDEFATSSSGAGNTGEDGGENKDGKPRKKSKAKDNLPRPVQDFLSFQDAWRSPYLSSAEVDKLKKAAAANKKGAGNVTDAEGDAPPNALISPPEGAATSTAVGTTRSSSQQDGPVRVVAMVPISDDKSWERDSLLLISKTGYLLKIKLNTEFYQKQLVRGLQLMKLRPGDEVCKACLASEDDTLLLAKADGSLLHTSVRAFRYANKGGAGVMVNFVKKIRVPKEFQGPEARKKFLETAKPAALIAFERVFDGGKNYDKTAKILAKDDFLAAEGIKKPEKVQSASLFFAKWRLRNFVASFKGEEDPLNAAKAIPQKIKLAETELYPNLKEEEKKPWLEKEAEDQLRYEKELAAFNEKVREHRQQMIQNRFVKAAKVGGGAGGGIGKGAMPARMLKADYLFASAVVKNPEEQGFGTTEELLAKMAADGRTIGSGPGMLFAKIAYVREVFWPTLPEAKKQEWEAESTRRIAEAAAAVASSSASSAAGADAADAGDKVGSDMAVEMLDPSLVDVEMNDEAEEQPENDDGNDKEDKEDAEEPEVDDEDEANGSSSQEEDEDDAASSDGAALKKGASFDVGGKKINAGSQQITTGSDKTCVLLLTERGRGHRVPVGNFAVEKKTHGGRLIKTELDDRLVAALVLHADHFDNNQNRRGGDEDGAGVEKAATAEKLFVAAYMEEQKGLNMFNGFAYDVDKEVEVEEKDDLGEVKTVKKVIKAKEYKQDVTGKFQLGLMIAAKKTAGEKYGLLTEEEKKVWIEKANAVNAENGIIGVAGGAGGPSAGGAPSAAEGAPAVAAGTTAAAAAPPLVYPPASPSDADDAASINVDGENTGMRGTAKKAGPPKQRPHHEVILLTSDGEAHRIIPTTIACTKSTKVARSRTVAKLATVDSKVVDASYAITWDVPEKAADRKARLAAERAAQLVEASIPEEDEEDESEDEPAS